MRRRAAHRSEVRWPFQPDDNPMAAHLIRRPKYVVTHRSDELSSPQRDISVLGSGALAEQLLAAELVDGLHLYVHPLVLGGGHQLLPGSQRLQRLRLEPVGPTTTGVVELSYVIER